ncbi:cell adhesion molecule-related/down-regulated by oncogenes [Pelodytes ibericus]
MQSDLGSWTSVFCLWILTVYTHGSSDVIPRFTVEPLSTVQKPGSPVTLFCSANPPWSHISWLFDGGPLDKEKAEGVEVQPGHLTISSLAPPHAGVYQCVASSGDLAVLSAPATVSVAYLEEFELSVRSNVNAEEGSSALIVCPTPDSIPKPRVRYKVRGKWLERSTERYFILPSGNLQILNVTLEDKGAYRCAAYNPVTQELKVNPAPEKLIINRSPQYGFKILQPLTSHTLSVKIHEALTLECAAGGDPLPLMTWLKDRQDAMTDGRRKLLHTHLVMERVETTDAGNYSCCFETGSSFPQCVNYTVLVLEPPSVTRGPENQSAPVSGTVRFICELRGNPPPNITWVHNGALIPPSARYQASGNKLRITNVNAEDSGIYQCVAENGVGVALSTARLAVQLKTESSPIIVSAPTNITVTNGNVATLTCNATGSPTPYIQWYDSHGPIRNHPSQVLRPKPRKSTQHRSAASRPKQDMVPLVVSQAGSSSLYIQAVTAQHSGKYTCEASNEFGSTRTEAFLTVVPYETNTKAGDRDLAQSDEGDYESSGPVSFTPSSVPPTDKPLHGASLPEAPIILSPPQTAKPDMYFLVWRSGKDGGLPINAYFVRYRKLDDEGNMVGSWNSIRVPASESEFPLTELEPSSLYEVLMVARNAAGEGQPAMLTFRTSKERVSSSKNTQAPSLPGVGPKLTFFNEGSNSNSGFVPQDPFRHSGVPEAPDRPTISAASETSVYVTWIPRANGGSPITSFKVEFKRARKDWVTAADNIPPSKLSVEVSNLEPGATYKFRVIAINHYGGSECSTVSRPYQVAGYSNRISNPLIVGPHIDHTEAVTDTQIMLKWTYTPSNNNNTPIQGFYIYYRPTDSDNDSDYKRDIVAAGTKQKHFIRDLLPETSYDIKMQCYNERGASDFSNVMICETKAKRNPGASEYPVLDLSTPPTFERGGGSSSSSSNSLARSGDMLYVIVGCVLGGMVLILMAFIAICLLKHRQQSLMQKFEPSGYLYQGADPNGQIIEYTTLAGIGRINGNAHGGFIGNGNLANGCPHVHPTMHTGINAGVNGELYPGCTNSLKAKYMEYENLSHHLTNGGVLYTAIPQADLSECINCRNCCNNNRCLPKANGSCNGVSALPVIAAFRQESLDTPTLDHGTMCLSSPDSDLAAETDAEKPAPNSTSSMGQEGNRPLPQGEDCPNSNVDSSSNTWSTTSKDCGEKEVWSTMDIKLVTSSAEPPQLQSQEV